MAEPSHSSRAPPPISMGFQRELGARRQDSSTLPSPALSSPTSAPSLSPREASSRAGTSPASSRTPVTPHSPYHLTGGPSSSMRDTFEGARTSPASRRTSSLTSSAEQIYSAPPDSAVAGPSSPRMSSLSSSTSSKRKVAPPPLSLRRHASSDAHSEPPTSETSFDTSTDSHGVSEELSYGTVGQASFRRRDDPSTRRQQQPFPADEERDTLSNLFTFPSPKLDIQFPSSTLSFTPPTSFEPSSPQEGDTQTFGEYDEDTTNHTSSSFMSNSTGGSASSSSLYGPSGDAPRQYSGLGLGLPFSVSAAANLSSLSASAGPSSIGRTGDWQPSWSTGQDAESQSRSTSGAESPVTDRSKLIGLGELATPRWTSSVLERKWGTPLEDKGRDRSEAKLRHSQRLDDEFDALRSSYMGDRVPTTGESTSPTLAKAPFRRASSFGGGQPSLLPNSASTASLQPAMGLIDFSTESGTPQRDIRRISSAYSIDAVSVSDASDRANSAGDTDATKGSVVSLDAPRRYESARRKSAGAAASAPSSASGGVWTTAPGREQVGLGFEYESAAGEASIVAAAEALGNSQRRASSASAGSRRSSASRPLSAIEGSKASKATHHRRQSASKSGFAHLPPSPAASTASQPPTPGAPLPLPTSNALSSSQNSQTPSASSGPVSAGRTPDLARLSHHTHSSSPSTIAASILRQTRDLEVEGLQGLDIDTLASVDSGTAEALRKLDGLSSPRLSKVYLGAPAAGSAPRSRTTSRDNASAEENKVRRRGRSSTSGSSVGLGKDLEGAGFGDIARTVSLSVGDPSSPAAHSPHSTFVPSPVVATQLPAAESATKASPSAPFAAGPTPRSPISPQVGRTPSHFHAGSSGAGDIPFPPSSTSTPFKRGSSSSASINAGTSRDSTSGASAGASSVTTAPRTASSKTNRRGSASSDVSSINSSGPESAPIRVDWTEAAGDVELPQAIPPVPPIPKDWESYRPSTAGTSFSAQNSPRFEQPNMNRRPSDTASLLDAQFLSVGRAPEMEASLSSNSNSSMHSLTKTPTRKWSISGAFGKSKSPKPGGIKESASFTDLPVSLQHFRDSSYAGSMAESAFRGRISASTNDIAGLAAGNVARDSQDTEASFKTRSSGKSEGRVSSSFLNRTRTSSMSSNSTTRTANATAPPPHISIPAPSVVATTPGRSRSSLLSPRRTPSGIPFFSRKTSTGSVTTPSPNPDTELDRQGEVKEKAKDEDRSGRKSILGLNFLRNTATRKEKEKAPPSPTVKRQTFSSIPAALPKEPAVDEFGRRASVALKTTSMLSRKRGKTLGSVEDAPPSSKPLSLPPMQMSALSQTTVQRVDSLSSIASASSRSTVTGASRLPPPTRTAKLQESVKGNLPTIAGSPSNHVFPLVKDREGAAPASRVSPSVTPPPKSHTPTKIPRLNQRAATVTSPKMRSASQESRANTPPSSLTSKSSRRLSYYGATPDAGSSLNSSKMSTSLSTSHLASEAGSSTAPSDFGILREPGLQVGEKTLSTRRRLDSEPTQIPRSRSSTAGGSLASRPPVSLDTSSITAKLSTGLPRATRRQSLMASDGSKHSQTLSSSRTSTGNQPVAALSRSIPESASTSSLASTTRRALSKASEPTPTASRRVSAASTTDSILSSKPARTLTKVGIPSRIAKSSTSGASPPPTVSSGRSSTASTYVSEEELQGDAEMSQYVVRQRAKKSANGMSAEAIRKMFEFPDPTEALPPLEAQDAVSLFSQYLTDYEKKEIRDYKQVYFVGPKCQKKPASEDVPLNNFGYDDDRGDYLVVPTDHILYRYEIVDILGKGSFGQVLQCRDHKTGEMVAIKIIRNKKRFHHQALVEIKVLENLVKWDPDEKHFVVRMTDSFTFRGHLCIVTELLSINLYELVKANSFVGFSTTLIRRFTTQILGSLILLRHHRVVHCDLKPENILLKHPAKSAIKVIDFGSSCFETEKVYTYIQSRFYRSPEVILGMNYHMAIDMWSLGCIIAEMYTGYPIFPGENEQEQLACIMEVMGLPEKYLVDRSSRKRLFFDSTGAPRPVVNSKGRRRRAGTKTLAQVLKCDDDLFIDFIAKSLTWDPDRRLKPDAAMRHPWIATARAQRALSPTVPGSTRSARSSNVATPSATSANMSVISSPRRKVGSGPSVLATPSHSHHLASSASSSTSNAGSHTAPVQRTRTSSTANQVPRLQSKGSLALPGSSTRYSVKS